MRDAQIEDIARAVGINRAIVYRHFSGKEELFALTLVSYLDELHDARSAFISVMTHPTTAGVLASFASLGDVIVSELRRLVPDLQVAHL